MAAAYIAVDGVAAAFVLLLIVLLMLGCARLPHLAIRSFVVAVAD